MGGASRIGRLLAGVAGLLAAWQAVVLTGWIPREYLPGVPEIARQLLGLSTSSRFWSSEAVTLWRAGAGLALATALGVGFALLGARLRLADRAMQPAVDILRSLPPSALVPLAIFSIGLGWKLYLFIIVFGGVWPVYVCAQNALRASEPVQLHAAAVLGWDASETLWRVRLPAALPEIFSGIRIAAGACLISTVAVEMLAGQSGVGFLLFDSAFSLRTAETFALLVVAGCNGLLFQGVVASCRRWCVGWHDTLAATAEA
jgi:NitT/TauT family transport system permease protein